LGRFQGDAPDEREFGPRRQGGSEGVRRSTGHGIGVSLDVYTSSSIGQKAIAAKKPEVSVLGRNVVRMPKR